MSDVTPTPPTDESTANAKARRWLTWLTVILIILLMISSYMVYRAVVVPKPKIAGEGPVDTKGIAWVRSIYGTSNNPNDLFRQTQAAVPAGDGTIWVTDIGSPSSVMKFSPTGQFLSRLQSLDPTSPITSPSRLAIGPDGLIYICETTRDRIHVLTPEGRDAGTFSVPQPVSVAVSADRIAVGAVSGFAVLDKKGKPLGVVGSRGKGPDQFDYVHGIAFGKDGSIYVADSYNNRLSAYEPDGKRRWIIRTGAPSNSASMTQNMLTSKETSDTKLKGADALQLPLGLTVDGAGRIVVIDMFECSLAVFDPKTGAFLGKYGDVGADDGQFFYPVSVGYDPARDWFTVADAMNRRVQIVRIPGSTSAAGTTGAAVNRLLSGPFRACVIPFLLLLIATAVFVITYFVRRRRAAQEPVEPGTEATPAS